MIFQQPTGFSDKKIPGSIPGVILLVLSIILSLCVYQHYGISWDEAAQREIGQSSFRYIFLGDQHLRQYVERDHGVGMELPLYALEKVLGLKDISDVYLMRHLVTNLFFLLAVFCGYKLLLRLFKNQWIALLGFLLLTFNPRFYAHSYFNSKDIPFLSMFIICFSIAEIAFRKGKWQWHLLLGIACGYTTTTRILAVILPAFLALFYLIDLLQARADKQRLRTQVRFASLFVLGYCITLYAAWPILWHNPIAQLIENFQRMAHFRWDGQMMFFGKMIKSTNLPWTYLPGWFSITIPELWVVFGFIAVIILLIGIAKAPGRYFSNTRERNFTLYLMVMVVPVLAIIALNSVILDDWRHLYFIYPGFVFIMLALLDRLGRQKFRVAVVVICVLQLADTAWFMIKSHPFQQVYFNRFVSHEDEYLRKNFDFDYWGSSYKQGLHYLLEHDTSSAIKVWSHGDPVDANTLILNSDDRKRVILVGHEDARYFLTNFRYHPGDFPEEGKIIYEIKMLNSTIMRIQDKKPQ